MREPDLTGPRGRAWRVVEGLPPGNLAVWLVHTPGMHTLISWWAISVAHMRPLEGCPPVEFPAREEGSSHQVVAVWMDGDLDPDDRTTWRPGKGFDQSDFAAGITDDGAQELGSLLARGTVDGQVHPDSDFRTQWRRAVARTAEHLRGEHAAGDA
jgi:hypothetical protein